jgi:hypothetical protein
LYYAAATNLVHADSSNNISPSKELTRAEDDLKKEIDNLKT